MTKTVLMSGASGLLGGRLASALRREGWQVRALSRRARPSESSGEATGGEQRWIEWGGRDVPASALRGAEAVVHLAGEPIFGGLPTAARRERIFASRVESTRAVVDTIGSLPATERPATLVCASAVGFYGDRGEDELTESAAAGNGFLAELCAEWEQSAAQATQYGVRVVSLRLGIILAREAGALPLMALPFRLGLGGKLGSGRQWVSWIHIDDAVELLRLALDSDSGLEGAVNATAPTPVRNETLTRTIAARLGRPAFFNVPAFALRAALGELSTELLGSHRVLPAVASAQGFEFRYPTLESAIDDVLG